MRTIVYSIHWIILFGSIHLHVTAHRLPMNPKSVPAVEVEHDPGAFTSELPRVLEGTLTEMPDPWSESPDFRIPEPPFLPYKPKFFQEHYRPYRISPSYKQLVNWPGYDYMYPQGGCYCTTVYNRLTVLAGCAVITTRHIITTASSTWLVLKDRLHYKTLENVLGFWYDSNRNVQNSSMYGSPSRIHFHPLWLYPEKVNRSHPLPFTFDLAVWANTFTIYYENILAGNSAPYCLRSGSYKYENNPPTPPSGPWLYVVVGFQFIWAYRRKPMPWFKYAVKTKDYIAPCPKTEWGWYICIPGDWAKYGIDSGAALHRSFEGNNWSYSGLLGLGVFSMKLRSLEMVHYFLILDCHIVLDFLYEAYLGYQHYIWKDARFENTKGAAPKARFYISTSDGYSDGHYEKSWNIPLYK